MITGIIKRALKEDIGNRDVTTDSLVSKEKKSKAIIISRQEAVICGIDIVRQVFKSLDKNIKIESQFKDGAEIKANAEIMKIQGNARAILTGERVALNFLSHLSGIATETRKFVKKIRPYKVKILDTRKTTPGLRILEKYAIKCGGGFNHRLGLWEMVLIKDNHKKVRNLKMKQRSEEFKIKELIEEARRKNKNKKIEIEVENLQEFKEVLLAKPDTIMLDNMNLTQIRKALILRRGNRSLIEASGNINLNNVRAIAKTGVDMISLGSLTHSVKAIDFSLEVT